MVWKATLIINVVFLTLFRTRPIRKGQGRQEGVKIEWDTSSDNNISDENTYTRTVRKTHRAP
jgi:hypothetical protein